VRGKIKPVIRLPSARKAWRTVASIPSGFWSHNRKAEAGAVTLQELKKKLEIVALVAYKGSRSDARQMCTMVSKPG
jgi:hypothetical protein